jgi:hypothetical protein
MENNPITYEAIGSVVAAIWVLTLFFLLYWLGVRLHRILIVLHANETIFRRDMEITIASGKNLYERLK